MRKPIEALLTLLIINLCLNGCTAKPKHPVPPASSDTPNSTELLVFAPASLNKAFPEISEKILSRTHPEIKTKFSFEGSSTLVEQIKSGAPADVFASADEINMNKIDSTGLVTGVTPFTSNTLTLIVPAGNPGNVTGINTLKDKTLVVCAPEVPCGNATLTLAKNLGIAFTPVSEEQKVTDVRAKIENGQADAGLVYVTDAKAAGNKVETIEIPGAENVVNLYLISILKDSKHPVAAKSFIDAVLSARGQQILAGHGFLPPTNSRAADAK